ncbi:MAG: dicarboxylate/amino acid:cation symporter [Planctomycetota bacterium]|nr:MAG: dicarboxylate/amino acid:cation symporter [Planctomycetota bacterium]
MFRLALHWQILIAMVIGSLVGLMLNLTAGRRELPEAVDFPAGEVQPYGFSAPVKLEGGTFWSMDCPERILMQIVEQRDGQPVVRRVFVGVLDEELEKRPAGQRLAEAGRWPELPPGAEPPSELIEPDLGELKSADPEAYVLFLRYGRSTARIAADGFKMVGDLFLRLLKMVSVPLIIFSITTGVMGMGTADALGRMFGRTITYYIVTSMLAITTGLLMVNIIRPGADDNANPAAAEAPREQGKKLSTVLFEQIENMIPPNPVEAVSEGQFLGIIAYSLAFAIFAITVGGKTADTIRDIAGAGFEVMMKMTMAIIKLAPVGVLCLMLFAVATQGLSIFGKLGFYMLTVACALAFHALVTLPLILKFVAKRSPRQFAQAMSPALLTAFSSASSNATLPLTLASVEERAGVSNRISSFVLPLGATINMDGTALYEVVAVLFIANLTPGVDLSVSQQIIVAFTALLASIGAAGIPHAGLVMMVIILQAVGLPTESQGLIIAVDRILDMARTCVNVWSDSCGCAVIARFEP